MAGSRITIRGRDCHTHSWTDTVSISGSVLEMHSPSRHRDSDGGKRSMRKSEAQAEWEPKNSENKETFSPDRKEHNERWAARRWFALIAGWIAGRRKGESCSPLALGTVAMNWWSGAWSSPTKPADAGARSGLSLLPRIYPSTMQSLHCRQCRCPDQCSRPGATC